MKSIILSLLMLALPCSFNIACENDWGFFGHKKINELAVYLLPPELFPFYRNHIEWLIEHATDPDKRRYSKVGEAECHYIDLDHYGDILKGEDPFFCLPKSWNEAVWCYGEDSLRAHGIVPWNTFFVYRKLVKAFVEEDKSAILRYSAELGHYVGDAHVPLHTTSNYNGQQTNQHGIHGFWESRLPELFHEQYDFLIEPAKYYPNVSELIWTTVRESHEAVDSVLSFEKQLTLNRGDDRKWQMDERAGLSVRTYSKNFSEQYHQMLNGQVERRMRLAVHRVASLWYSAWVEAGQPNCNSFGEKSEAIAEDSTIIRSGRRWNCD